MTRKNIDISKKPSQKQINMLEEMEASPIVFDEDCRELTEDEILQFRRISDSRNEGRKKQTVSLRLSPQAIKKARSLGKGYTSVLSRMLEAVLSNNEAIKKYL